MFLIRFEAKPEIVLVLEVLEGSVLLTIRDNITVNLDHVCLDNQSHYSLDVIEFQSELCDTQSPFMDIIGMNEKWCLQDSGAQGTGFRQRC